MRKLSAIGLICLGLTFPIRAGSYQQTQDPTTPSAVSQLPESESAQAPATQHSTVPTAQPETTLESATILKATTRLVMLDIVATDAHGHAIPDLESKDFTVLEDGKSQTIRAFGLQYPVPADSNFQIPALPPNVFTNIPRFHVTSLLNVILLDGLNTSISNQANVRQMMLRYVETMPTNIPTAVYTLGQKLRMVQDFTTDPNILKQAIKHASAQSSPVLEDPVGGSDPELYPPGYFDSLTEEAQEGVQRFETERTSFQTDLRVRYTMDALQSIAHSLAGYQGRKNLVWISEAFPLFINPDVTVSPKIEFVGTRSYVEEVANTAEMLAESQVSIYPIDAGGLVSPSLFSASGTGRDRYGRGITSLTRTPITDQSSLESTQLSATHDAMNLLAERTGGKAYYSRNDIDGAIRDGMNDGSTYYMLGYYPENKNWNGKFRKVQVKVDRAGAKLRHRLGYYAVDPQTYVNQDPKLRARDLGDALSLDHPISTALFFQAGVIPPSEKNQNKVIVNYAIDAHALMVERGNDGLEHADVECVVQAYSEKGKPLKTDARTVQASMKPETFKAILQSWFSCKNEIELPAGHYLLRLAIRDDRTGLIGTANAKVSVPELSRN